MTHAFVRVKQYRHVATLAVQVVTANRVSTLFIEVDRSKGAMRGWVEHHLTDRHERRARELRPRVCRWMVERFFSGRVEPAAHLGV